MEQHPIPQQISSYEFRLVGDMTLKQFLKLAGGVLLAYTIFNLKFIFIFRFLLAILFLFLGIGSAFFPINDRPLEFWLFAFLKSIYSPTLFIWKKNYLPRLISRPPLPEEADQTTSPQVSKTITPVPVQLKKPVAPPSSSKNEVVTQATPVSPVKEQKVEPQFSEAEVLKILKEKTGQKLGTFLPPEFLKTPLPATPVTPNIVNGLVLDDKGKIVEGAIVEIQDQKGNPIRAMRTNPLGQFQTATPLPDGNYLVLVEKEPYQFDIIKIDASGKIIPPLKVVAKKPTLN